MQAIGKALLSLYNLTGIEIFREIARPILDTQHKLDKLQIDIEAKKAEIKMTKDDIKYAADQRKSS